MTKASDNPYPGILIQEVATDGSDTGTPAADFRRLFLGEDGALHLKDSSGTVTGIGSGAVGTDAIWDVKGDLAVGTGSNTAQRLAVGGTNGHVLTVASGETTGLRWAAVSAGGGSGLPLDDPENESTLSTAYGDAFTGTALGAIWTSTGAPTLTYQEGGDASSLGFDIGGGAAHRSLLQSAPAGDWEITGSYTLFGAASGMFGLAAVASDGEGVFCGFYQGTFYVSHLSANGGPSNYDDARQTITNGPASNFMWFRHWIQLRKVGAVYDARFSFDGIHWSPYSTDYNSAGDSFTINRFGFMRTFSDAPATYLVYIRWFDYVDLT